MTNNELAFAVWRSALGTPITPQQLLIISQRGLRRSRRYLSSVICHLIRALGENDSGNKFLRWATPNLR